MNIAAVRLASILENLKNGACGYEGIKKMPSDIGGISKHHFIYGRFTNWRSPFA